MYLKIMIFACFLVFGIIELKHSVLSV